MEIKRDDPGRLKNFRARHQCDKNPGPKWKARYWSCKFWEKGKSVTDLLKK
jgi:REP element-mobilizing transposase RayT